MAKKYIMHRVSHEYEVSHKLMKNGYLSIGFNNGQDIYDAAIAGDWEKYNDACNAVYVGEEWWASTVKRSQPFRFLSLSVGDVVVVPLWYGLFSIFEVIDKPIKIADFDLSILGNDKDQLQIRNGFLYNGDYEVDLGFLLPVKPLKNELSRNEYANARLTSRMKFPQTNTDIDDIADSVDRAINAKKPINFYDSVINDVSEKLLQAIKSNLNPDKFEKLIKWFMEKQGFEAYIPSKNEPGKTDGADADLVASNDLLKIVIHIQGKFHEGVSGSWAVDQIARYTEQTKSKEDYTYIQWVISSADDFTDEAKEKAVMEGIRLIDGFMFARMLIDAGVDNIDKAFE